MWPALFNGATLSPADYFSSTLFDKAITAQHLAWPLALSTIPVVVFARHLGWKDIDPRRRTRLFIVLLSALFAWVYSTLDVNFYLNQVHLVDRLLLVSLWLLLWVHPFVVPLFVAQTLVFAIQLHFPLPEGDWMWPDKRLPIDALILFQSFLIVKAVAHPLRIRVQPQLYPFATLCLTGATYVHAGINKARLGPHWWSWVIDNEISNLLVSARLQANWLGNWSTESILRLSNALSISDPLLGAFAFCAELSAVALLLSWRAARIILAALVLMHLGIVSTTGIFFWKWIVFDVALIGYIYWLRRDAGPHGPTSFRLFGWHQAAVGAAAILLGPSYARLVPLAWMDTQYVNFSRYFGVTSAGARYPIDPYFFAPYDVLFTQSRFYYLDRGSTLVGTYGVSPSYLLAKALNDVSSIEDLARIRRLGSTHHYHAMRARAFGDFVGRFVTFAQANRGTPAWLRHISPPYHFQRKPIDGAFAFQADLAKVEIVGYEYFHQDGQLFELSRKQLATIELDPVSVGSTHPSRLVAD